MHAATRLCVNVESLWLSFDAPSALYFALTFGLWPLSAFKVERLAEECELSLCDRGNVVATRGAAAARSTTRLSISLSTTTLRH